MEMEVQNLNSRIWWIEHQIRGLIAERGMRPAKAIRRVAGKMPDATLQSLVRLWQGETFGVEFYDGEDAFVAAYEQVHSCMAGKGAMCHRAYAPHGIVIVTVTNGDKVMARALVRLSPFMCNKAYGPKSFALLHFLSAVMGVKQTIEWIDDIADEIRVYEWRDAIEKIVIPSHLAGIATVWQIEHGEVPNYLEPVLIESGDIRFYKLYSREMVVQKKQRIRQEIFRPYLDTH